MNTIKQFKEHKKSKLAAQFTSRLRTLMIARGYTGRTLAKAVGVTPTSISNILNGHHKPRPQTFKKLVKKLCIDDVERESLITPFKYPYAASLILEELPTSKKAQIEQTKARLKMAKRVKHLRFAQEVHKILKDSQIPFQQEYIFGDIIVDFLITIETEEDDNQLGIKDDVKRQIALITDSNPYARHDPAVDRLLRNGICVDEVVLIVPHAKDSPHRYHPSGSNSVINTQGLIHYLNKIKPIAIDATNDDDLSSADE